MLTQISRLITSNSVKRYALYFHLYSCRVGGTNSFLRSYEFVPGWSRQQAELIPAVFQTRERDIARDQIKRLARPINVYTCSTAYSR